MLWKDRIKLLLQRLLKDLLWKSVMKTKDLSGVEINDHKAGIASPYEPDFVQEGVKGKLS